MFQFPRFLPICSDFGDLSYDWPTGGPNHGNEWRMYRVVPRVHRLRPLVFFCCLFFFIYSVDVSDIFYFFLLGGGEGGVQGARRGRGSGLLLEMRGGEGGFSQRGGGWPRGLEGVCGEFGGGLNIFFRGRNSHQV